MTFIAGLGGARLAVERLVEAAGGDPKPAQLAQQPRRLRHRQAEFLVELGGARDGARPELGGAGAERV